MLESKPSPQPASVAQDRRRHQRTPAQEDVTLCVKGPKDAIIAGQLVDLSTGGFRVRHDSHSLSEGQEVRLLYRWGDVAARVVWSRDVENAVETGFTLL